MSGDAPTHFELKALIAALEERLLESDEGTCERKFSSPGDDVISHLCATMAESDIAARKSLADLEINRLEQIIRAAKEEHRDIHCAHGRIINSKSFINRLPYDIITDIFNRCVECQGRATSIQSLSHTCHHWRNIMLDTPQFWNQITCNITESAGIVSPDKIHTYVKRSNRLPLLLSITAKYPDHPVDFGTIMYTLKPYFPRCIHLEVKIPQTFAQLIFATPLPLLRSVSFTRGWELRYPEGDRSVNPSRNAPSFDHLHLDTLFAVPQLVDWSPERIVHLSITNTVLLRSPPPMPHLETLSLHDSFSDQTPALDFLDNTPSLRTLRLIGDYSYASYVLEQVIKIRSESDDQGQGIRPLGFARSIYVSQAGDTDKYAIRLADAARYHLEHPAVNKELVFVLNCGLGGSPDNLAPPLRELVTAYLPTNQVLLAFDDEDICTLCVKW